MGGRASSTAAQYIQGSTTEGAGPKQATGDIAGGGEWLGAETGSQEQHT